MDQMQIIEELKEDQAFLDALKEAKNVGEMKNLFGSRGIDVTEEQLESIINGTVSEELSEEDLDNVAGGGILVGIAVILFLIGLSKGLRC